MRVNSELKPGIRVRATQWSGCRREGVISRPAESYDWWVRVETSVRGEFVEVPFDEVEMEVMKDTCN